MHATMAVEALEATALAALEALVLETLALVGRLLLLLLLLLLLPQLARRPWRLAGWKSNACWARGPPKATPLLLLPVPPFDTLRTWRTLPLLRPGEVCTTRRQSGR
jgi:hypothetical protein